MILFENSPRRARLIGAAVLTAAFVVGGGPVAAQSVDVINPPAQNRSQERAPDNRTIVRGEAAIEVEQAKVAPDFGGVGLTLADKTDAALLSDGLWAGLSRRQAAALINAGLPSSNYTALDRLVMSAVLTGTVTPPEMNGGNEDDDWLVARSRLLLTRGHFDQLGSLGAALGRSGRAANPALDWDLAAAQLWSGGLAGLCADPGRAAQLGRVGADPRWQLLDAACKAQAGDTQGAEFSAEIARELGIEDEAAFMVLDYLNGYRDGVTDSAIRQAGLADGLRFAMAVAAGVQWPRDDYGMIPPAVLANIAGQSDLPLADRIAAAELARASGFGTRRQLRSLYEQAATARRTGGAVIAAADMPYFDRALAYQNWRSATDREAALDAAVSLLMRAQIEAETETQTKKQAGGKFEIIADLVLRDFNFPEAAPDYARHAAVIARACLAVGLHDRAGEWTALALANVSPSDFAINEPLRNLWPLLIVSAGPKSRTVEDAATPWLAAQPPERRANAATVFAVAEALGRRIPETAWQGLQEHGGAVRDAVVLPALPYWRGVAVAAARKKRGEVILLSSLLLAKQDSGAPAHPAILSSVVSSLKTIGAVEVAHQVAIDAVLEVGF